MRTLDRTKLRDDGGTVGRVSCPQCGGRLERHMVLGGTLNPESGLWSDRWLTARCIGLPWWDDPTGEQQLSPACGYRYWEHRVKRSDGATLTG